MIELGRLGQPALLRLGLISGLVFLVAVFSGWSAGYTEPPTAGHGGLDQWQLPAPHPEDAVKDIALLKNRNPWSDGSTSASGAAAAAGSGAAKVAPELSWRLAGIIRRGTTSFALIATGPAPSTKLEYKQVGDKLPDGSVLVQITSDSATTKQSSDSVDPNYERVFRLFGSK